MSTTTVFPITEVAIIPFTSTTPPSDPVLELSRQTISSQPGFLSLYHGSRLESPTSLQNWAITWTTIDAHHAFEASPGYKPFLERLGPLCDGPAHIVHYPFRDRAAAARAFEAPATEFATMYIRAGDAEAREALEKRVGHLFDVFWESKAGGWQGGTWGWGEEEVELEGLGEGGEKGKGKACLVVMGWDSKEAHEAYRGTEAFKGAIAPVREVVKKSEMWHCEMHKYQGGRASATG
ncbi:MAG: hypothetical protein Q9165_002358 [Trypethelium subeluteriae]